MVARLKLKGIDGSQSRHGEVVTINTDTGGYMPLVIGMSTI